MCTIIYSTKALKSRWPNPLATEWRESYPNLFDEDDFRLPQSQPKYHFNEWLAAMYHFHRDGVHALVTEYHLAKHQSKRKIMSLPCFRDLLAFLQELRDDDNVAPPDLLLYRPGFPEFWFAEVKGPNEPADLLRHRPCRAGRSAVRSGSGYLRH